MKRNDLKDYALKICIPLMERNLKRHICNHHAYKPDQVGFLPADLENFCRPFWGIAPILAEGEEIVLHVDGQQMSVSDYMKRILLEGLAKGTAGAWDKYKEYYQYYSYENQNITELAGLMIGIFFARKQLWECFSNEEKDLIATEIYRMSEVAFDHSWPNNHYWFPLFAITVLKRLGYVFDRTEEMLQQGLDFLDSLYIGNGWYQDGVFGRFDYYEAWSLHLYPLLWTLIADESFADYQKRRTCYIERTNQFIEFYTHWFDEKGAHVPFGRSLSYRFAASALFPVAVLAGCDIDAALAGRITVKNIEFFKNNIHIEDTDILPEGYLYHSTNVVEGYTSDGGAYWCCKAFLSLLIPEDHLFWNIENGKLPIECSNFLIRPKHKDIHMLFEGYDGIVNMYNNTAQYCLNHVVTHPFGDMKSWYSKFVYNSAGGFGCAAPDKASIDSMISLMTPERSMISHRQDFTDLGYTNGILDSIHTPFANDKGTWIETFIFPLGGAHVRIHKVKLSQEYYVQEGGFSLGRWDDYIPRECGADYASLANHEYCSELKTLCCEEIKLICSVNDVQASCHLYAPLAAYPMYRTEEPLKAGEYVFVSAFALTKIGLERPDLDKSLINALKIWKELGTRE